MPSPFPGMNPYLEVPSLWNGFHTCYVVQMMAQLNSTLPKGYVAAIEEYVWIQDAETEERHSQAKPDLLVPEKRNGKASSRGSIATLTMPTTISRMPKSRKRRQRYLSILTPKAHRVVTVLELLSPSNKGSGPDRIAYEQKRRNYLSTVNLVEIDLLRTGNRLPMGQPSPPTTDYYVFLSRADQYPRTEAWAFSVQDSLPIIPIPTDAKHPDTPLNLQECFDAAFDAAGYSDRLKYSEDPDPPLYGEAATWSAELLQKHFRRRK